MTSGTLTDTPFTPAWWLPGGHTQTLWRKFMPQEPLQQKRQRIELDDGDFIDIDWVDVAPGNTGMPNTIVVLLHGLCGCSLSSYIIAQQRLLADQGISSVAVNYRGCSGEINRLARAYHSGATEDVAAVHASLRNEFPGHDLMFIGYSLGANVLLKWLGESGRPEGVQKAVAVSTPFSLALCSQAMLQGASSLYGRYFVRKLLADFQAKKRMFQQQNNFDQLQVMNALRGVENVRSIWEFDDLITAPLHGFRNADDYYSQCSALGFLPHVEVDTLLIQSLNDPLIPPAALPGKRLLPDNIQLYTSTTGGHVGFISGQKQNWLECRILEFIQHDA